METYRLNIVGRIHELLVGKGLRLSLAESCTAGLVSRRLSTVPGASEFLDSSLVCYSIASKKRLLSLSDAFLKKHGTISEETARAMAEVARELTGSDVTLSVTGVLGPAPVDEHQPGLVFIAVCTEAGTSSRGLKFEGTREEIRDSATWAALEFLYQAVSAWT